MFKRHLRNIFSSLIFAITFMSFVHPLLLRAQETDKKSQSKNSKKKANSKTEAETKANPQASSPNKDQPSQQEKKTIAPAVEFKSADVWSSDIFTRDDHKVIVLQERKYNKSGGFEFGVHGAVTSASAFYSTLSYGAHADYYFSEYWGLEAFYNYSNSTSNADQNQLNEFLESSGFTSRKEYHKPIHFGGLAIVWAPIYGKFAFFRSNIIHFDIYLNAGLGYLTTETNKIDQGGRNQNLTTTLAAVGARVFLAQNWSLRFDLKHAAYKQYFAPAGNGTAVSPAATLWRQNWQFALGTSFIFGAHE